MDLDPGVLPPTSAPLPIVGSRAVSLVGELGLLKLAIGNVAPFSRAGTSRSTAVGNRRIKDNMPGEWANMVTDRRGGTARIKNSAGKLICLLGGRRDRRAE